ncbi:L-2-keto-3-deoxyarabonate dehydratase [Tritonibacter multivorans]|uniref:L-2-keto-3-deoxyarabonate dehydratase n=1 Tax=Tritonibacter multivorans TaxID=928856 RepID=A0A0P1G8J5_9RHOB|nr:dihydrodipicolinate synthase family protein [Tritonibacter multivorans]MDA7422238.1 dihydrodipicolinate synthase family protein [Tritonibacter multivorans]CUH77845.1 L-2-keto-3-deoxyarabonate dehydratase [Tritonibacter multivorans]SFD10956.1 4-hydroxy-tetrahydrodipicolinate synthase [Tritonibacter multivorans]
MTAYTGIWPVAPTPFNDDGTLDLEGMKRVLDCLIDQGADGICILANFSEQFLLSDAEREVLTRLSIEHIAGRVPVIVTISHYATQIAVERAQLSKDLGADIVMMMPPYHGALLKGTAQQTFEQFQAVGEVGIPIMVQDAPLSGVDLPVPLLVKMAREIEQVKLFKIECPRAANKLRDLIAEGGDFIEAPFDGEEAITLLADLDAGATGSMTSGMIVDQIKPVLTHYYAGRIDEATAAYGRVAMAINHENRQCGWQSCKAAMVEGGVIKSDVCRHPIPALHPAIKSRLLDLLKPLDPMVLTWGK